MSTNEIETTLTGCKELLVILLLFTNLKMCRLKFRIWEYVYELCDP